MSLLKHILESLWWKLIEKKKTCMEKTKQFCLFLISPEANAKEKDQLKKEKKVIYAKPLVWWNTGFSAG